MQCFIVNTNKFLNDRKKNILWFKNNNTKKNMQKVLVYTDLFKNLYLNNFIMNGLNVVCLFNIRNRFLKLQNNLIIFI